MVEEASFQEILDYAKYFLDNQTKLYSDEFYSLFIRRVGTEVVEVTKASPEQNNLPEMENDGRAVTTFTLRRLDFENFSVQNEYKKLTIQLLTKGMLIKSSFDIRLLGGFEKFIPNDSDMRIKRISEGFVREGQESFRRNLMLIYSGKCAVTNTNVDTVLEAAHIVPYNGIHSNHIQNGIILRRDIHRLFDTYQLSIDPKNYLICIEPSLVNSEYWTYNNKPLEIAEDIRLRPSKEALKLHFEKHLSLYPEGANTD